MSEGWVGTRSLAMDPLTPQLLSASSLPNCLLSSLTINISPQPSLAVAAAMSAAALSPWWTIPKAALGRRGSI